MSYENCGACGARLDAGWCWWCSRPKNDRLSLRSDVQIPYQDTSKMAGTEFELFVRDLLIKHGYDDVQATPATGDMGADLIVTHGNKRIVVQCKRYNSPVGVAAIQEVLGAKHYYNTTEAWVITDSTFTPAARRLAVAAGVRLRELRLSRRANR